MIKSLFSKESLAVFKDKKLLIAITAVIFVPILYAGMFLWAFWDPYNYLDDIPVAIVNEDEGYEYEGEFLTLGDELVDKLKEEPEFDFHFVDKETGYQGLHDQDYYILIEIPENFSKNSSTVMDDHPQQIELIYTPNESFNFLASQIGETAMLHIEMALEEKITETYAETIFEKIDEVADGLVEASDATEELNDGALELKEGSEKLKDNLVTLADKTVEFKDGVGTARKGTGDLSEGTAKLADGMNQLNTGGQKLLDASREVESGSQSLAGGISQVSGGLQEMQGKMPELVSGTNQVQEGLTLFQQELPKEMAKSINGKLEESTGAMNAGLDQLENGIVSGLNNKLAPELSKGLSQGIASGIADQITPALAGMPDNIASQIAPHLIAQQEQQIKDLFELMGEVGVPPEQITKMQEIMAKNPPDQGYIQNQLKEGIAAGMPDSSSIAADIEGQLEPKINNGVNDAVGQTVSGVQAGFKEYKNGINSALGGATAGLEKEIARALDPTFNQLSGGLAAINEGQKALQGGVAQLSDGTKQLQDGSKTLAAGQSEYVKNMALYTEKFSEANSGTGDLADGATKLLDGMGKLEDGSDKLTDGSKKLADGSEDLDEGMDKLVDGTEEFNDKMHEAADEANDVNASEETNKMIANPVEVENEKINEVPNYGTGFAPYFLSLGLFVGALLLSIVYPLREPSVIPTSGFNWFLRKFLGLFVIGVLQAIIASVILLIGLGIEVQSVPLFILYSIITSLVFITLIQFLVTCFDDPGRFMAIIILILQLTTSAGTFPLELIPKLLQPLNAVLPMTYTVAGFKAVVSSGEYGVMWQNAGILLIFTVIFMLLTLSYFMVMYKRKFGALGGNKEVLD